MHLVLKSVDIQICKSSKMRTSTAVGYELGGDGFTVFNAARSPLLELAGVRRRRKDVLRISWAVQVVLGGAWVSLGSLYARRLFVYCAQDIQKSATAKDPGVPGYREYLCMQRKEPAGSTP